MKIQMSHIVGSLAVMALGGLFVWILNVNATVGILQTKMDTHAITVGHPALVERVQRNDTNVAVITTTVQAQTSAITTLQTAVQNLAEEQDENFREIMLELKRREFTP